MRRSYLSSYPYWLIAKLRRAPCSYTCNICGRLSYVPLASLRRETPSCELCGSTPRFRSVIHALSLGLFGESLTLQQFPRRPEIRGIGLSDWNGYADRLAAKFAYTNTFLHTEPRLDITRPDPALGGTLDFLIASEVFEHVARPVEHAFANVRKLLKPGGVFVLTVPYGLGEETVEHFPEMRDYAIIGRKGSLVLQGTAVDGCAVERRDLHFHGGEGETLEMRLFARDPLLEQISAAGFKEARVLGDERSHGVVWPESWSRPILAIADNNVTARTT